MAQTSIINPEFILNFNQTPTNKMKHFPKIPSFCNSKFNPIIVKVHDSDNSKFLKSSSKLINSIHCRKPIFSKVVNFNRISEFDDDDDDYLDDKSTNHFEMGVASSNNAVESSNKIWHYDGRSDSINETGRFDASLLAPKSSSSIIRDFVTPVRKTADVINYNGNIGRVRQPNDAVNGAAAAAFNGLGGLDYHNRNDRGTWDGRRLMIFKYDAKSHFEKCIMTNIIPEEISSWFGVGGRVFQYWLIELGLATEEQLEGTPIKTMYPDKCWPGSRTVFGRLDGGKFTDLNWPDFAWDSVQDQINCVRVFAQTNNYSS